MFEPDLAEGTVPKMLSKPCDCSSSKSWSNRLDLPLYASMLCGMPPLPFFSNCVRPMTPVLVAFVELWNGLGSFADTTVELPANKFGFFTPIALERVLGGSVILGMWLTSSSNNDEEAFD